jgi:hypothetical protein
VEINDVSEAVRQDVRVHQAEGVLAALLDVPIGEAVASLELKAQFAGHSLVDAAQQVLDDHEQRLLATSPPELGDRALAILRQHLNRVSSPLDEPTR